MYFSKSKNSPLQKLIAVILITLMSFYGVPLQSFIPEAQAQEPPPSDVIKLPSPITLARTQSAFSVDTAENGQLTINYLVINSRDEEVGEILLTTTLEPGVTLMSASPEPDQPDPPDGRLAFVLPSIPPYGEVSATLTVSLPPGLEPITVDAGASVFGNLRSRAVEDSLCPTVLQGTLGVFDEFLASTIDANTSDRYVLQVLGEHGCGSSSDETARSLFEFVRDEVSYEIYSGSLRGARGTLWSQAGNSLDQASLLIALLRASGIPARYASGILEENHAQQLILSMFNSASRVVGGLTPANLTNISGYDINDLLLDPTQFLPYADEPSDPANDPDLLDDAQQHFWVEYYDGTGFVAMDPSFEGAQIGDIFTSRISTFAEVDDALRHKVRFQLDTEMLALGASQGYFQITAAFDEIYDTTHSSLKRFGSLVVQEKTVLDHTLSAVELAGEPVSIGHFVEQLTIPGILTTSFYTYSPWMQVGGKEDIVKGAEYEEVISSAGSNIVAGVFLRLTVIDSQGNEEKLERTIIDRIGHAVRRGEGGEVVLDTAGTAPVFSNIDMFTVHTLGGLQNKFDTMQEVHDASESELHLEALVESASSQQQESILAADLEYGGREFLRSTTHAIGKSFLLESGRINQILQKQLLVRSYQDTPRVVIVESRTRNIDGSLSVPSVLIDIRKSPVRTVSPPGSSRLKNIVHRMGWGLMDAEVEAGLLERVMVSPSASIMDVLSEARNQEVPLAIISLFNLDAIDDFDIAADTRTRIREAAQSGLIVIVPEKAVQINGVNTTMWLETDPRTGETYSVAKSGGHEAAVSYGFLTSNFTTNYIEGYLNGLDVDLIVPMPWNWGSMGAWMDQVIEPPEFVIIEATCFKVSVSLNIWEGDIDWNVPNPYNFLGCMSGVAVGLWFIVADIFDAAFRDPGLNRFQLDPEPLATVASNSKAFTSMDSDASLDGNNVAGNLETGYYRLGEVALYPEATNGIGASGKYLDIASSPNFAASLERSLENTAVSLDAVTGLLVAGGTEFPAPLNVGVSGFQGTINGADNGPTDTVDINGTFERILLLSVSPEETTTPHNTPVTFNPTLHSNAIDAYNLSVEAPEGWSLMMAEGGLSTITPPVGLNSGTYEVRIQVESQTIPELRSEKTVLVTVTPPDTPAVDVRIVPDAMFSVPQQSTLIKTAYRIEIQNISSEGDTFDVSVAGLASEDFTLAAETITVEPGETGIVGIAVHLSSGIAPAGTPIFFSATATGRATGLTDTDSISETYPEVAGVLSSISPGVISTSPGNTVSAELSLVSKGNVTETLILGVQSSSGLQVNGVPSSVTLSPGEALAIPVTVEIPADAPVGIGAGITVTADLCYGESPESCAVPPPSERYASLSLLIGAPELGCLLESTVAAVNSQLWDAAGTLQATGNALSRLVADPADGFSQSKAITSGNALMTFLHSSGFVAESNSLREILLEIETGDAYRIQVALGQVCTVLADLSAEITNIADQIAHGFKINLTPNGRTVSPGEDATYTVMVESTGSETSTVNLALEGLPAGVTGSISQNNVVLSPEEVIDGSSATPITVTLSSLETIPSAVSFSVTGQVSEIPTVTETAHGTLAVRESAVDVVGVSPQPAYIETAGDPIAVSAEILNTANITRTVSVAYSVKNGNGDTVFTGTPTTTELPNGFQTVQADLGSIDTTGLANGPYTIVVQIQSDTGSPIPGGEGRGAFLVGIPIFVSVSAEPSEIPPGNPEQILSTIAISSGESSVAAPAFPDQYAKVVGTSTGTTNPEAALGHPDQQKAIVNLGGALVLDMGEGLDRVSDGPGPDLYVFQSDLDGIPLPEESELRDAEYFVEVAEGIDGPYFSLGTNDTSVDERTVGDGFDLLSAGITSARFVRISPDTEGVAIDAVLANHTHQPSTINIEHFTPTTCSDCAPITEPCNIVCLYSRGIENSPVIGDLTGDGSPEIVFTADTINPQQHETIVINGITKNEEFRITLPEGNSLQVGNTASPAIGDIDGNGQAEIVVNSEAAGILLATNPDGTGIFDVIAGNGYFISPALENIDDDPYPEILLSGGFIQHDGTPGSSLSTLLGTNQPVAADLDDDGKSELVAAHSEYGFVAAFESDGTLLWQTPYRLIHNFRSLGGNSAQPVIADLNSDGSPDLIFVGADDAQMNVTVLDSSDGSIIWQTLFPKGGKASRPAVADINGDDQPEVVLFPQGASSDKDNYVVALDKNGDELWRSVALDPEGSHPPSVSAADLDGDGAAEVLWNGARSGFTIFDGRTGNVLYRNPLARSLSAYDYPTVADVDADGYLEVVTGSWDGLYIFGNDGGWGSGRNVWNQSDYRITNVNDDLSIPVAQTESWLAHNTYQFQKGSSQDFGEAVVEVTHQLGSGVTFLAEDILSPPTQVSDHSVTWGNNSFPILTGKSFTVPVTTPVLQPGESEVISESTGVNGSLQLQDGQVIDLSIALGDVSVYAPHIIGIDPSSSTVTAGDTGAFNVNIRNIRTISETFSLDVTGIDPALVSIQPTVILVPGEETILPLTIATSVTDAGGTHDFSVIATGDQGTVDEVWAQLEVHKNQIAPVDGGDVYVDLVPVAPTAGQGASTFIEVIVTNTGYETQTFNLSAALPPGITGVFQDDSLTVSPGVTASRTTVLELLVPLGTPSGTQLFVVNATSSSDEGINDSAEGSLQVSELGVHIDLTPDTALITPGQDAFFEATVSNIGLQPETFNLSLGGPFAVFACLADSSPCPETLPLTLVPGESQTVGITVSDFTSFLQQRTMLVAQAVSATDPQAAAIDVSAVDIGAYRAVSVDFEPLEISGSSLDPVDYLLKVRNAGNACDERYTMELSSDPPGVSLVPETTEFLVPPQLTAGINVAATAPAYGTYTIQAVAYTPTDNPLCPPLAVAMDSAEASLILTSPAVCGNGIQEEGEGCDDDNLVGGDCCSSTCQLEPAGSICRPSTGICDVEETCDGVSAQCPGDILQVDGTACDDDDLCTSDDVCLEGECIGSPPGECPTVLTTSGPCDVNGDGLVDELDDNAYALSATEEGNVCQELNALGGFVVSYVTPPQFAAMTSVDLNAYDCIVLDTKPGNVGGLGIAWHDYVGVQRGGPVFLTTHDALWHSYFNRVLAPPGLPDDRFGPQTLIMDGATWACRGNGLVVFDAPQEIVPGAGYTSIDSLPPEWGLADDSVDNYLNALGTDILIAHENHPIYGNLNEEADSPCDTIGPQTQSVVPNSISSFPSYEFYSCPPAYNDESYSQLFHSFNPDIFAPSEIGFSKEYRYDQYPDLFVSDGTPIDGYALSLVREEYNENVIYAPAEPIPVNTNIDVNALFSSCPTLDSPTALWEWGDGTTSSVPVYAQGGGWSVEGEHEYAEAGVYTVGLTLTDDTGGSCSGTYEFVVVYNPSGGFVTGGGWIDSPGGAYYPDPSLVGKANFGFVSKYKKGTTIPTGQTEFQFKVANLDFHSDAYEWLVIAGSKAQFKGVGKINGEGEYRFLLQAKDSNLNDNFDTDQFRIRIWEEWKLLAEDGTTLESEEVVYDNGLGDDVDNRPTEIGGGAVVIHKSKK